MKRLPIVGVMGSGTVDHTALAEPLGTLLATKGVHLLTGGGKGVMEAVSRAFVAVHPRVGSCIGIIPGDYNKGLPKAGYPNRYVEIPIYTHLPHSGAKGMDALSRNHINVLTSNILIFLPGGDGTHTERMLALQYDKIFMHFGRLPGLDNHDVGRGVQVSGIHDVEVRLEEWLKAGRF